MPSCCSEGPVQLPLYPELISGSSDPRETREASHRESKTTCPEMSLMVNINLLPGPHQGLEGESSGFPEMAAELCGLHVSPPTWRELRHLLQTMGSETTAQRMLAKGGSREELWKRFVLNVKTCSWEQRGDFSDGTDSLKREESSGCLSHPCGCSSTILFWS